MTKADIRLLLILSIALALVAALIVCALSTIDASAAPMPQPRAQQFIPLVAGGNAVYPPDPLRYANSDYPLTEWDYPQWCAHGILCNPAPDGDLVYTAPAGFVVTFVRIFSYDLAIGGASVLYPWDGCFAAGILCVKTIDGTNISAGDARAVRIYSRNWGGHWQAVDICHGLIADPGRVYCDGNYATRTVTAARGE